MNINDTIYLINTYILITYILNSGRKYRLSEWHWEEKKKNFKINDIIKTRNLSIQIDYENNYYIYLHPK